jgi:S-formylglutathione hydrolase
VELLSEIRSFGGRQLQYKHTSVSLNCDMQFSIFLPPQAESHKVPVLYWLSGLTCDDQNFVTKAGAQRVAAEHGIAIVCPDTSPRGDSVPDDPQGAWDFGLGAGFYVNATQSPWDQHYQMGDYVTNELPSLIEQNFSVDADRRSISGHSMGGHGALTIALRNTDKYRSVSAFAPIVSPLNCPWGVKALSNYIGEDKAQWRQYDACELVRNGAQLPMLVDQGLEDGFLEEQLKTHLLEQAVENAGLSAQIRYQDGYDHSYFFISSFIEEHIVFHKKYLSV